MSAYEHIDLLGRGGALSLLLLWSWILIRDHRSELAARLAVLMNFAIASYLLVTSGLRGAPEPLILTFAMAAQATPGLFWLFAKAWFNDEKRVSLASIGWVVASLINSLIMINTFEHGGIINDVSGVLFRVAMLAFAAAALWEVWRSREGDLIEARRKIRPRLVAAVAIYVVVIAIAEIAAHRGLAEHWLVRAVGSPIIFIVIAFCAAMLGMRQPELFGPSNDKGKATTAVGIEDPLVSKLLTYMESELPHRDETMSITKLSAQLGEQEYRLRRTINRAMGHRNFASFLNGYRLTEVRAALADPAQTSVPIITIALDAGFGSLGPFNRAFRDAEGMTPSEYRARATG